MSYHQPFKPSFGGKFIVIGCSDKIARANLQEPKPGPKVTTYQRATAALEAYWAERAATGRMPLGDSVPGGEKALAYKTREACWKDSVHLDHQAVSHLPEWQGMPADIEDKEQVRTRGIPGFTGKQPAPGQSKPPPPAPDTSSWVAINAFDEPRPRVKGIAGYIGHQPPPPRKATQAGAQQPDTQQQMPHADQHDRPAWGLTAHQQHAGQGNSSSSSSAPSAGAHVPAAPWHSGHGVADQGTRPGSNASEASTVYSPRFFLNGVEVTPERVQLPPPSAVTTAPQQQQPLQARPSAQGCLAHSHGGSAQHQQQQFSSIQQPSRTTTATAATSHGHGPPRVHVAWGVPPNSTSAAAASCGAAAAGARPGSSPGAGALVACCSCCGSSGAVGQPRSASCGHVQQQQQQQQQQLGSCPGLPRTRATTYAAAFNPASGFGIQQYMESLKLAGSMRPASALPALGRR